MTVTRGDRSKGETCMKYYGLGPAGAMTLVLDQCEVKGMVPTQSNFEAKISSQPIPEVQRKCCHACQAVLSGHSAYGQEAAGPGAAQWGGWSSQQVTPTLDTVRFVPT